MKSWTIGIAGLTALALLIAGTYGSLGISLTAVIGLCAAFGFGWPHYLRVPAKKTLAVIIALSGSGGAVSAAFSTGPGYLMWLPVSTAAGIGGVFVVQLVRGTGQSHRLESTLGASAGVLVSTLAGGWIAAERFNGHTAMMLITGLSAAVALLVGLIRWPDRVIAPLAVGLAALTGPMAALLFSDVRIVPAAIIGAVVAAVLMSFRHLAGLAGPHRTQPGAIAMGLAPIAALGTLIYFIDRLLIT
ncbi:permease [Paenarthrobacter sp. Z7-10]|uniref:permease n=1 Tax=Paenarthrobacter sp. Z7-10 TaxID=2787635 RepID=UPI0022A92EF4|nr:permease [Paenarthrobacter sp. Z7-10]MCZ2402124.1 permease [Paenarthrobacter sp. Z7-10]